MFRPGGSLLRRHIIIRDHLFKAAGYSFVCTIAMIILSLQFGVLLFSLNVVS